MSARVLFSVVLVWSCFGASHKREAGVKISEPRSLSSLRHYLVNGRVVAVHKAPDGAREFTPEEKWSALISEPGEGYFVVELHRDVERADGEFLALSAGLRLHEHPDLLPHHILVHGDSGAALRLTEWDEVAYIFPAAARLVSGRPVVACSTALTEFGGIAQYIASVGEGWDGAGKNPASLTFSISAPTNKLSSELTREIIERALGEWSRHVRIQFSFSESAGARNLDFLFASGAHGDPYSFDGTGHILAHTFYPPPNPETLAGDLHLDADENWQIGVDMDLFSVVLHEIGHALGLGHADDPSAVMYPYYKRVSELNAADVEAVRGLYASTGLSGSGSPSNGILTLIVQPPPQTAAADALDVRGQVTGGSGEIQVRWRTDQGAQGTAEGNPEWIVQQIPLAVGRTIVTFVASDSDGSMASKSFIVMRTSTTAPAPSPSPAPEPEPAPPVPPQPVPQPSSDRTAPSIFITSPATSTVLTGLASMSIRGTAQDNVGVTEVTWSSSEGGTGLASGTASWSATVPLLQGRNTITIRAKDAAGNIGWRTVAITRR